VAPIGNTIASPIGRLPVGRLIGSAVVRVLAVEGLEIFEYDPTERVRGPALRARTDCGRRPAYMTTMSCVPAGLRSRIPVTEVAFSGLVPPYGTRGQRCAEADPYIDIDGDSGSSVGTTLLFRLPAVT